MHETPADSNGPDGDGVPGPRIPEAVNRAHGEGWPVGFAAGSANRRAAMILASLPSLTPRRLLGVARRVGTARACLAKVLASELGGEADRAAARRLEGSDLEAALAAVRGRMVFPEDEEYPSGLGDLADPPLALFVRGRSLASLARRVAVVGARNSTPLGQEVAKDIGRGIAGAGGSVVSGAARGIDTAAHEGALQAGGATIAVLGSGIDVAYPARNARLLERLAHAGAVVTEYPPGVPAQAFRFPARNRIVAALAEAVVIVEGAAGSGSLITADHALDLGRQVFAVPGPVTSPLSEVPLSLIRDGATLVRGARDVVEDLGWAAPPSLQEAALAPDGADTGAPAGTPPPPPPPPPGLDPQERGVLDAVGGRTLPEHVAGVLGWPMERVMATLLQLELRGLVRQVGGRFERRLDGGR